jgi:hypothetical protein
MLLVVVVANNANSSNWMSIVCSVLAFCLCAGVFTPYVCALSCVLEISCFSGLSWTESAHQSFLILATASLAVLGPGAHSLDARLFGRRVIRR